MKISSPTNFHHLVHVDKEFNWSFDSTTSFESLFKIVEQIGRGGFGSVYKLLHIPSNKLMAGKSVNPESLSKSARESLIKEIEILKTVTTPFTIQYYGNIIYDNSPMILMEYCEKGSLRDIIDYHNLTLTEDQISFVLYDLLQAILILHKKYKILHRDIKSGNLLLTSTGNVKVTDFGVSRQFDEKKGENTISKIGTPYWMAPEVCAGQSYSYPADVWSIGCTAIELAEGAPPYCELEPMAAMIQIYSNGFPGFRDPKFFSNQFKDFILKCFNKDPTKRETISGLLEHRFIQKVNTLNREHIMGPLIKLETNFERLLNGDYSTESIANTETLNLISIARNTIHQK